MHDMKQYWVYIMANIHHTIYVGITSNLLQRAYQHQHELVPGFTSKYGLKTLVWYADTGDVIEAISREKQIKAWRREKKITLIESVNPNWEDLSAGWYGNTEFINH